MNYFIRSSAIEGYEKLVYQLGLNPQVLLAEVGFSSAQIRKPEALLSYLRVADLLDITALETKDPLFSLRLASTQKVTALGDLLMLGCQQLTVAASLEKLIKHIRIHANGLKISTFTLDSTTQLHLTFEFTNRSGLVQLNLLSSAQAFNAAHTILGGNVRELRLCLIQPEPTTPYTNIDVYKSSVSYSEQFNGLQLPTRFLRTETIKNDATIQEYLEKKMQHLEELYPQDITSKVTYVINDLLSSSECSIENVASTMNVSPRMLQIKLKENGTSFSRLLKEARLHLAKQLLANTNISIEEIALSLGYAETAVFSRFFKNATGLSPKQWVKNPPIG